MKPITVFLASAVLISACGEKSEAPLASNSPPESPKTEQSTQAVRVNPEQETARLTAWLDEQFARELDFSPLRKTQLGDKSDQSKLDDFSEAAAAAQLQWRRESVAQMQREFDYDALTDDGKLSYDMWVINLERDEEQARFQRYQFLLGRGGAHASLPNFMINFHRVDTVEDAEAYIARLEQLGTALQQVLERAKLAVADGIRQPRFNYDFAIEEVGRVMSGAPFIDSPNDSPLWADIQTKINALMERDLVEPERAEALINDARSALTDRVQPAYLEVLDWLQTDREQAPTTEVGAATLPDGEAYYRSRLRMMTTLDLTADAIHETGLAEVARIRDEMAAIKEQVGFEGSLADFFVFMREAPQFYFPDTDEGREAYLALAREYLDRIDTLLPEYFGILPKTGLEVRRVEAFREQDGAAQHYSPGTPDGSRPGVFYAHLSDMTAMPRYQLENISYHEGSPGHHMQIAIAQELEGIPRFRTQSFNSAFVEGWALYTEALGKDMGLYEDPYSDFGRLAGEIWRAIRLVVDTGIHAKGWSEEQAIAYFLENSPQPAAAVRSEVRRYITNPGQATAYKIGMLKIQELRRDAEAELGDAFDIRGFHDTVLGGGTVPLPVLESRVQRWVEEQKRGV